MMPIRIQRKRTKGWKMPDNTISVTRPGEFGNPFIVGGFYKLGNGGDGFTYLQAHPAFADSSFTQLTNRQECLDMYEEYLKRYPLSKEKIEKLKGKNLACFCPIGLDCHADILLKIVNS